MMWSRQAARDRCDHTQRETVTATGVTRARCQLCGHVSFRFRQTEDRPPNVETIVTTDLRKATVSGVHS